MNIMIHHETNRKLGDALNVIENMDDDWKYVPGVVNMIQGWMRVDVYDEDGDLVVKGF